MATNVIDIRDSIKSKLDGVSSLRFVYDYRKSNYDGFPCAVISFQGFESDHADNARDLRRYVYTIQVVQERDPDNFGASKAERVLQEAIDDIMTTIDADSDFSNSEVVYSDPFEAEVTDDDKEYLVATITITTKALILTTV